MSKRRKFTSSFKTKVVLEALKERSPLADLIQKYQLDQPESIVPLIPALIVPLENDHVLHLSK